MATKHGWPDRIGSFKRQAMVEVPSDTWEPQYLTEDEYLTSTEGGMPQYERGSKEVPFDASMVEYEFRDKWAFFQVSPLGFTVDVTLGDAEGAGEYEFDSKGEALESLRDWSDMLAEGGA